MNKIDGIQKMPAGELKKKREIILGVLGEDIDDSKLKNVKVDGIFFAPKISMADVSKEKITEAEKKHAEEQKKEWQEETQKKIKKASEKKVEKPMPKKTVSKKSVAKKTKEKRIQFTKKFHIVKTSFTSIASMIRGALKKIAFVSMAAILFLSIIYFSFFLFIVSFQIDNTFLRHLERYLPVPAMIVDRQFVDFYDYIDTKAQFEGDSIETKKALIEKVIVKNFDLKYKNNILAATNEINYVTLNRVRKIKAQIDAGEDFGKLAGKYGDRRESINISTADFSKYDYGDQVKNLNEGEVSNVIFSEDGYYIFKCFDRDGENVSLSYIFIQAKNFDQYVKEKAKNIYFVSFVD